MYTQDVFMHEVLEEKMSHSFKGEASEDSNTFVLYNIYPFNSSENWVATASNNK